MNTKRSVLTIVLAAVLVFSIVGMASAAGTQEWYWTNYATGLTTNADYQMNKTSGHGTDHVRDIDANTELIWVADEAVTSGPLDMSGSWTGNIQYFVPSGGGGAIKLKVEIGVLTSGGTFTPKDDLTLDTTGSGGTVYDWPITLSPDPFSISNGQYLAIQFTNLVGSNTINVLTYYTYKPGDPTYINSPSADPGYPVPELSTILLTSVGMLMLGGFVVYSRRRNNK